MRIATVHHDGSTRAARLVDDDTRAVLLEAVDLGDLLRRGVDATFDGPVVAAPLITRLLAPGKVLCVGLNYRDHIAETNSETPAFPTLFNKFTDSICGPLDDIALPAESVFVDWEAELTIVIGREARRVTETDAPTHIAGYTVGNDLSMRDWQRRTSQFLQGKAWEATTPLGPVMVTVDELDAEPDLRITTTVVDASGDATVVQDSRTSQLLFGCAYLVSYISTFTTLHPGDVIMTGTPGGVGTAMKPPRSLQRGETVEVAIDGIGACRNLFV